MAKLELLETAVPILPFTCCQISLSDTENACMVVLSVCRACNTLGCLMECVVSLGNEFSIMFECHVWIWSICWIHNKPLMLIFYSITMCRVGGGVLHIHRNVNDSDETRWLDNVVESISNIAKNHGKNGAFMLWSVVMQFCPQELKFHSYAILCRRTILERVSGARWTCQMVRTAYSPPCSWC